MIEKIYALCPSISFDYAILEKIKSDLYVLPLHTAWSDLGSWNVLLSLSQQDANGNAVQAKHSLLEDTSGTIIQSTNPNKLVVVQGLKDYIVVDTQDVLLICARDKEQDIKRYTEELKKNKLNTYL